MNSIWNLLQSGLRLLKVLAVLSASLVTIAILSLMVIYFYFSRDLPTIQTVSDYRPYLISQVFGSDGSPLAEFWSEERRELAAIPEIPPLLIRSFIAAEDARFFEHHGVDFKGTLRAFLTNLKAGGIVQGGSTITQQVTRSLLLSRKRSFARKIREAILATRLERYLTKDQILYLYLNQIYFGNRAYGVEAAAHNYFHKNLDKLGLGEMALLAGLPKAPISYSPFRHPEKARERQTYVLSRLLKEGAITEGDLNQALNTELKLHIQGTDKETNLKFAPHFAEYLRQILLQKYGEEKLYTGGLKIYTTIDPKMQRAAKRAVRRGLRVVDRRTRRWRGTLEHLPPSEIEATKQKIHEEILQEQSSRFVYFPPRRPSQETPVKPGRIYKAIVTGFQGEDTLIAVGNLKGMVPKKDILFDQTKFSYDENLYFYQPASQLKIGDRIRVRALKNGKFSFYQEPEIEGALFAQENKTGFVRAMVGGYDFRRSEFNRAMDALRQPGSSFKVFTYTAALDKGYTIATPIADTPFAIPVGDEIWAPKNYDGKYHGLTTVHQALVHSYNVASARIGYHIRLHYLTAYLRKMGITTPVFKYPSMTLGANSVHLNEMVGAYATLPNLGVYKPPLFITKIVDKKGEVLEEYVPPEEAKAKENAGGDFNEALFEANKKFIDQEGLTLYPSELKVLYGNNIPPGHVMTPQTAYLMIQILKDVVQMGTGQRVKKLNKPVAGKTGTSNDITDTWFIGFVPDLTAGVWVGYDRVQAIGKGEQGGRTAAPIFLDFMQAATKSWEAKDFSMPPELKGQNLFALAGGSAKFAEYVPMSSLGLIEGGTPQDRASDFMEADMNGVAPKPEEQPKRATDEEAF